MSGVRVGVFVATRADLGPLVPVIRALAEGQLTVATAVGYDESTLRAELADRGLDVAVSAIGPVAADDSPAELVHVGAALSAGAGSWIVAEGIEVLVVLGDRWELMYAVPPAVLLGVRIVHIHGGEITEGALDDRVRHAVSKLADQHAVATDGAARVVAQLGEQIERIHRTGAPGLDLLAGAVPLDDAGWRELLGHVPDRPVALVTLHPATASDEDPDALVEAVLAGTLELCRSALITHPGPDPGRALILRALEAVSEDPRVVVVPSLGRTYPQVLRAVDVVVGNSSSGVIEAPAAGVPSVDVGARQAGRERAPSVRHSSLRRADVAAAVAIALGSSVDPAANPYGDGHAADRIAEVVSTAAETARRKPFVQVGMPT